MVNVTHALIRLLSTVIGHCIRCGGRGAVGSHYDMSIKPCPCCAPPAEGYRVAHA